MPINGARYLLTKDERIKSMNLKKELERRRTEEKNDKLIIFRGEIIEKRSFASVVNDTVGTPGAWWCISFINSMIHIHKL